MSHDVSSTPAPDGYEAVFPQSGFNAYAGPIFRRMDGDHYLFTVREHHLNGGRALHGGMMMAVADIVMGRTVRVAIEPQRGATISLNCDFIGPAALHDEVIGRATITRKTKSIVFLSATLSVGTRTVMTATGLWKILNEEGAG